MKIIRWGGALLLGTLTAVALATPATAHHNQPVLEVGDPGDCGQTTISTSWPEADEHQVDNTVLVVQAGGEQHTAAIGETIEVGPFEAETTILWRVWGGGERDYDNPPLADLDALLAHLENDGGELDPDTPGVAWHELVVDGCPPASPTPTPEQTASPSPSTEVSAPASTPTGSEPAAGVAGGGDELPVTGSSLPLLLGGGALLLGAGSAAVLFARRRRVSFTA